MFIDDRLDNTGFVGPLALALTLPAESSTRRLYEKRHERVARRFGYEIRMSGTCSRANFNVGELLICQYLWDASNQIYQSTAHYCYSLSNISGSATGPPVNYHLLLAIPV